LYVSHDAYIFLNYIQTRIHHSQRSGHYERVPGRLYDVHAAKDCRPQAQRDQEPWQGGAGPSSHKTGNCTLLAIFVSSIPGTPVLLVLEIIDDSNRTG
jgi:hypothetical protein